MSKNIEAYAKVREEARAKGGDELVAKIDRIAEREAKLLKEIRALADALIADADSEDDKLYANVAVNEALSAAYAAYSVAYGKSKGVGDGQLLVLSLRSITNNIQMCFEDRDAAAGGILEKIKGAFSKPEEDK